MRQHENIAVFAPGSTPYYPQMVKRDKPIKCTGARSQSLSNPLSGSQLDDKERVYTHKHPITIIKIKKDEGKALQGLHPTKKPVALYEYLVKTYTQPGDIVLDPTMGIGTTGVACINTGRDFWGFETGEKYYKIADDRLQQAINNQGEITQ